MEPIWGHLAQIGPKGLQMVSRRLRGATFGPLGRIGHRGFPIREKCFEEDWRTIHVLELMHSRRISDVRAKHSFRVRPFAIFCSWLFIHLLGDAPHALVQGR